MIGRVAPRVPAAGLAAAVAIGVAGCGKESGGGGGAGDDPTLSFCVDENNRFRTMAGKDPFARSADLEAFAAEGAQADGAAHVPHSHFKATMGGGIAFAENEIPWWKSNLGDTHAIVAKGIQLMWDEGPGDGAAHGHYNTIVGPYTKLGCGVSIQGDETTVTMDYR